MIRRLALGAIAVGGASALLFTGATYAPFSDFAVGKASSKAGFVEVLLNGTDSATFTLSTDECTNMAPGHECAVPFQASAGLSTLSAVWAVTSSDSELEGIDCFSHSITGLSSGVAESGDTTLDHDPGTVLDGVLRINVADNNACQSAEADVTVRVDSVQSETPFN